MNASFVFTDIINNCNIYRVHRFSRSHLMNYRDLLILRKKFLRAFYLSGLVFVFMISFAYSSNPPPGLSDEPIPIAIPAGSPSPRATMEASASPLQFPSPAGTNKTTEGPSTLDADRQAPLPDIRVPVGFDAQTNSSPTAQPVPTPQNNTTLYVIGGVSFCTSICSLLGFVFSTIIMWKKEGRDVKAFKVDNELKEHQLLKLQEELRAANTPKVMAKSKTRKRKRRR